MRIRAIYAQYLLQWWQQHKRCLPWRDHRTPYRVWVAEMMLQQTQVKTVVPYFMRWMRRFPSVQTLAKANVQQVLKLWEGLGYYRRAHHLHRAAMQVVERFAGEIPKQEAALRSLPGIGRYSAGAILSMGWGIRAAAVDANAARVLGRFIGLKQPVASLAGQRTLWRLAWRMTPQNAPGPLSEAFIELGALVCKPQKPLCLQCPLQARCRAWRTGAPQNFPPPSTKKNPVLRVGEMFLINGPQGWLMRRRPPHGLWSGLWEFPWHMVNPIPVQNQPKAATLKTAALMQAYVTRQLQQTPLPSRDTLLTHGSLQTLGLLRHTLTHMRLVLQTHQLTLPSCPFEKMEHLQACFPLALAGLRRPNAQPAHLPKWRWVRTPQLRQLPLAKLSHKALGLLGS